MEQAKNEEKKKMINLRGLSKKELEKYHSWVEAHKKGGFDIRKEYGVSDYRSAWDIYQERRKEYFEKNKGLNRYL